MLHDGTRGGGYGLFHLARAAFFAIARRFVRLSFFALAFPPFSPPLRCPAFGATGLTFSASPVAISPMSLASCMGSRGRLGRLGMDGVCHRRGLGGPDGPRIQGSN